LSIKHVRFWGQSGHAVLHCICLLLTQNGHRRVHVFPNALLRLSCAFVSGAAMKRREFISLIGGAALSISDEVIE